MRKLKIFNSGFRAQSQRNVFGVSRGPGQPILCEQIRVVPLDRLELTAEQSTQRFHFTATLPSSHE